MSSPYVDFAKPPPERRLPGHPALRLLLAVFAVVAGVIGYLIAGIISMFVWTGCFIECSGENRGGGFLLAALAVTFLAAGPALVAVLYKNRIWWVVTAVTAALGSTLIAVGIHNN